MSSQEAVEILKAGAGTQWDPSLVDLLVSELPALEPDDRQQPPGEDRERRGAGRKGREVA